MGKYQEKHGNVNMNDGMDGLDGVDGGGYVLIMVFDGLTLRLRTRGGASINDG